MLNNKLLWGFLSEVWRSLIRPVSSHKQGLDHAWGSLTEGRWTEIGILKGLERSWEVKE